MKHLFFILLTSLLVIACGDDPSLDEDKATIEAYLVQNGLQADVTLEGVFYIIDNPGSSEMPSITSNVTVNYKGYYLDGEVFDENDNISFPLSGVIRGWQIGIPVFGKGGSGMLIIPSELAYGSNPPSGIRNNAILAFDIDLIDF